MCLHLVIGVDDESAHRDYLCEFRIVGGALDDLDIFRLSSLATAEFVERGLMTSTEKHFADGPRT